MITELRIVLAELDQKADRVKADGMIAPTNAWIDCYSVEGKSYARARSDRAIFEGKKLMALGRVSSDRHREYEQRINRRNTLDEIARRSRLIQELIDAELTQPIWEPPTNESEVLEKAPSAITKKNRRQPNKVIAQASIYTFERNDCVRLPSGHRAYVEKILDDGRVAVIWEVGGVRDDFPACVLELVE